MAILKKKPAKPNIATQQPAPTPRYTPGSMTPGALSQAASRRVRYGLLTGRDEYGGRIGPGSIEQNRLNRVGNLNASRAQSEFARSQGLEGADRNAAARGMGRSGIRAEARSRVEADAYNREQQFARDEYQTNLDAAGANAEEDYNFTTDMLNIRRDGEGAAYEQYLRNNPNPGATPAAPKVPTWEKWLATHPWAKTPAQRKVLRAGYDRMASA